MLIGVSRVGLGFRCSPVHQMLNRVLVLGPSVGQGIEEYQGYAGESSVTQAIKSWPEHQV